MLSLLEFLGIVAVVSGCAFLAVRLIEMIRYRRSFRMEAECRVQHILLLKAPRLWERF